MKKNDPDSKSTNPSKEDEIDITQLFVIIGNGFSNVFNFIAKVFNDIFYWIVIQILFIRKNLKKLILAAVIGGLLGGIYQYKIKDKKFTSSMTVEPNFGSAVQLYKNINYYLSLIEQDDHERLSKGLNISETEAESISWIGVEPYSNDNQSLMSFKDFTEDLDSLTINLIDYETYADKQPVESYKYHMVKVVSKDKYVFQKLEEPIINSVTKNSYYNKIKSTSFSNLMSRKNALLGSMSELDSLRLLYKKVLLAESQKENSGTNIFLSQVEKDNNQIFVFDRYMVMNQELLDVNKKLTEEDQVINVVSSFNSIGMEMNEWYRNFIIIGFFTGFLLVYFLLILKELNSFLIRYENSKINEKIKN